MPSWWAWAECDAVLIRARMLMESKLNWVSSINDFFFVDNALTS